MLCNYYPRFVDYWASERHKRTQLVYVAFTDEYEFEEEKRMKGEAVYLPTRRGNDENEELLIYCS